MYARGAKLQHWIVQVVNQYGYIGIAFLVALENIFPPIPSEVILTFGGFMTTYTSLTYMGVVGFATIGSVLGAIVLYGLGRWIKPHNMEHFLKGRWGRVLRINKEDVSNASAWFSKHGRMAVFLGRFIPIVRSLVSILAGMAHANMASFLVLTTAGTFIWNAVLVYLGVLAGASWQKIVGYVGAYSIVIVLALVVLAAAAILIFYRRKGTRTLIKNETAISPEQKQAQALRKILPATGTSNLQQRVCKSVHDSTVGLPRGVFASVVQRPYLHRAHQYFVSSTTFELHRRPSPRRGAREPLKHVSLRA